VDKIVIKLPIEDVKKFCSKWSVIEFSLFGSVLRDDFDPQSSDIDILIQFDESSHFSLFDIATMKEELELIFSKKVDLLEKGTVLKSKNPYRKYEILNSAKVVYEQAA